MAHATSFERKLNFIAARAAQMNDVALCANEVLRNDVMLRINEVALRANGRLKCLPTYDIVEERKSAALFLNVQISAMNMIE